jgi:hypothetical protein
LVLGAFFGAATGGAAFGATAGGPAFGGAAFCADRCGVVESRIRVNAVMLFRGGMLFS